MSLLARVALVFLLLASIPLVSLPRSVAATVRECSTSSGGMLTIDRQSFSDQLEIKKTSAGCNRIYITNVVAEYVIFSEAIKDVASLVIDGLECKKWDLTHCCVFTRPISNVQSVMFRHIQKYATTPYNSPDAWLISVQNYFNNVNSLIVRDNFFNVSQPAPSRNSAVIRWTHTIENVTSMEFQNLTLVANYWHDSAAIKQSAQAILILFSPEMKNVASITIGKNAAGAGCGVDAFFLGRFGVRAHIAKFTYIVESNATIRVTDAWMHVAGGGEQTNGNESIDLMFSSLIAFEDNMTAHTISISDSWLKIGAPRGTSKTPRGFKATNINASILSFSPRFGKYFDMDAFKEIHIKHESRVAQLSISRCQLVLQGSSTKADAIVAALNSTSLIGNHAAAVASGSSSSSTSSVVVEGNTLIAATAIISRAFAISFIQFHRPQDNLVVRSNTLSFGTVIAIAKRIAFVAQAASVQSSAFVIESNRLVYGGKAGAGAYPCGSASECSFLRLARTDLNDEGPLSSLHITGSWTISENFADADSPVAVIGHIENDELIHSLDENKFLLERNTLENAASEALHATEKITQLLGTFTIACNNWTSSVVVPHMTSGNFGAAFVIVVVKNGTECDDTTTSTTTTTTATSASTTTTTTTATTHPPMLSSTTTTTTTTGTSSQQETSDVPSSSPTTTGTFETTFVDPSTTRATTAETNDTTFNHTITTTTTGDPSHRPQGGTTRSKSISVADAFNDAAKNFLLAPSPIAAAITTKTFQSTSSAATVIAGVSAAAGGAPAAALTVGRALGPVSVIGCSRTNADGVLWVDAEIEFPNSLLQSWGFGAPHGFFARGAILGGFALQIIALVASAVVIMVVKNRKKASSSSSSSSSKPRPSVAPQISVRVAVLIFAQTISPITESAGMLLVVATSHNFDNNNNNNSNGTHGGDIALGVSPIVVTFIVAVVATLAIHGALSVVLPSASSDKQASTTTTTKQQQQQQHRHHQSRSAEVAESPAMTFVASDVVLKSTIATNDSKNNSNHNAYSHGKLSSSQKSVLALLQSNAGKTLFVGSETWYDPTLVAVQFLMKRYRGLKTTTAATTMAMGQRVRGRVAPYSFVVFSLAALFVALCTGVAKATPSSAQCSSMLWVIFVVNALVFVFDILIAPQIVPSRLLLNTLVDGLTMLTSFLVAAFLSTRDDAVERMGLVKFVSIASLIVVVLGGAGLLLVVVIGRLLLMYAKAVVVPLAVTAASSNDDAPADKKKNKKNSKSGKQQQSLESFGDPLLGFPSSSSSPGIVIEGGSGGEFSDDDGEELLTPRNKKATAITASTTRSVEVPMSNVAFSSSRLRSSRNNNNNNNNDGKRRESSSGGRGGDVPVVARSGKQQQKRDVVGDVVVAAPGGSASLKSSSPSSAKKSSSSSPSPYDAPGAEHHDQQATRSKSSTRVIDEKRKPSSSASPSRELKEQQYSPRQSSSSSLSRTRGKSRREGDSVSSSSPSPSPTKKSPEELAEIERQQRALLRRLDVVMKHMDRVQDVKNDQSL